MFDFRRLQVELRCIVVQVLRGLGVKHTPQDASSDALHYSHSPLTSTPNVYKEPSVKEYLP